MRPTTEAKVFSMCCDLLLGESRRNVATKFGITEKHLSRLLCTPEGRQMFSHLKGQLTDAVISEWIHSLVQHHAPKINVAEIIRKTFPQFVWEKVDKTHDNL